jgi:mRNA interferase HigB
VHIITRKRLIEFGEKHPDTISALDHWYRAAKHNNFASFSELRGTFSGVDRVGRLVVFDFDIGGNKARLIAYVVYRKKRIYIRHILTHKEYDKGKWKEEA